MSMINFELLAERVYYDWHGYNTTDLVKGIQNALEQADAEGFARGRADERNIIHASYSPEERAQIEQEGYRRGVEEAADVVEEKAHTVERTMIGLHLACLIRQLLQRGQENKK